MPPAASIAAALSYHGDGWAEAAMARRCAEARRVTLAGRYDDFRLAEAGFSRLPLYKHGRHDDNYESQPGSRRRRDGLCNIYRPSTAADISARRRLLHTDAGLILAALPPRDDVSADAARCRHCACATGEAPIG